MGVLQRPTSKFAIRVAVPVLLILISSVMFILLALKDMAGEVDRSDTLATQAAAQAALHAFEQRLVDTHGDYSVWDDAALKLYGTVDPVFANSNFEESTRTAVLFDSAYLLDEQGRSAFAFRRGATAQRGALEEFGTPLQNLIATVSSDPKPFKSAIGLMKDRSGAISAVAVGPVYPVSETIKLPTAKPRLLVISHIIDDLVVHRMGKDFVIEGLALSYDTGTGTAKNRVDFIDPNGNVIGAFTWKHPSRGDEAFGRIAPTAYLTIILIGVTILFLLAIGHRNVMDLRRREQHALQAARHDGLTGLANRAALVRTLEQTVQPGSTSNRSVAVVYLDLDGFKEVNDTYGHEAGDRLLQRVAHGFSDLCGDLGMLARVGGDEFALVLDRRETVAEAEEIGNRLVRFFHAPTIIDGNAVSMGTSVGVAVAPVGDVTAEELIRRADTAMYQAKELGRNRVAVYDPSFDAAKMERKRMAEDLRHALRHDLLSLAFQPIVNAADGSPALVEALLRWRSADGVMIPPDLFVSVAEENGLIDELGEWVLRNACKAACDWPNIRLAVNVSPVQFRDPRFDRLLRSILDETGFPPYRLELEMTETHLVAFPERAQNIIATLRLLGVTVALDDFGTGYSSIGYLRRFSFDKLKIDRSLVHGIAIDSGMRRLCEATVALGRSLNLEITAEGVESEAEADILREAGCHHLQGYFFARPMAAPSLWLWLKAGGRVDPDQGELRTA